MKILVISTPPPLVILSFAFIPAGSGGPKRGQTLAHQNYSTQKNNCKSNTYSDFSSATTISGGLLIRNGKILLPTPLLTIIVVFFPTN